MLSPIITVPKWVLWKGGFLVFLFAVPLILLHAKRKEYKECCRYLIVGLIGLLLYFHEAVGKVAPYIGGPIQPGG